VAGFLPLRHLGPANLSQTETDLERTVAFRGQYDYSLDAKNRLNVPPKFRAAFSGGLVLAKWLEPCVTIWTPEGFDAVTESYLATINPLSPERRKLIRFFHHNSFDAELDAAGRVTVNPKLLEHAGIEREVIVAGNHDHVEVWDRRRWQADQDELGSQIVEMAERIGDAS
jgi:MraZ protein